MYATPPGWYADPWKVAPARYWSGVAWTGYTAGGPHGAERQAPLGPGWPAWYGAVALLAALLAAVVVAIPVVLVLRDHELTAEYLADILQYAALVTAALFFARMYRRPTAADFGLRPTRVVAGLGWAALVLLVFWVVLVLWAILIHGSGRQTTIHDLGADRGGVAVVIGAILVIVVAPVIEEFFFRGFFFASLRSRMRLWPAALIAGAVFGFLHVFSGAAAVPPLAVLGVLLCLLYQRTGSLYPGMAVHATQNAIAYGVGVHTAIPSLTFGVLVLTALAASAKWTPRVATP